MFCEENSGVEIGEVLKRMEEVKRWALMVSPLRCGDA